VRRSLGTLAVQLTNDTIHIELASGLGFTAQNVTYTCVGPEMDMLQPLNVGQRFSDTVDVSMFAPPVSAEDHGSLLIPLWALIVVVGTSA
jgi:hypothetical protein